MKEPNDYKKLYWDLLESWSDLKIKHGCAIEETEQLRKERDELAHFIRYARTPMECPDTYELAKRVTENGNA